MNVSDLLIWIILTRKFEFIFKARQRISHWMPPPAVVGALIGVAVIACQIAAAVDLQNELQGGQ
jgi:hypothetical protein